MVSLLHTYQFFTRQKLIKNASLCTRLVVNPTTMDHFHSHSMLLAVLHRKQKPSRDEVTEHNYPNSKNSIQILTVAEKSVVTALEIESNRVLTARLDTWTLYHYHKKASEWFFFNWYSFGFGALFWQN